MKPRRGDRERPARIGGDHHRYLQLQRSRGEDGRGAALHRLRRESGAVRVHAAKRAPGAARREPTANARTSTSAAPGGTTASNPANSSLNSTLPPTVCVLLFLPEYDGYPGGARMTFTLAPRLTMAPGRGDCATARPLPRSSGSREAWASLRVAVRAPRPETRRLAQASLEPELRGSGRAVA